MPVPSLMPTPSPMPMPGAVRAGVMAVPVLGSTVVMPRFRARRPRRLPGSCVVAGLVVVAGPDVIVGAGVMARLAVLVGPVWCRVADECRTLVRFCAVE